MDFDDLVNLYSGRSAPQTQTYNAFSTLSQHQQPRLPFVGSDLTSLSPQNIQRRLALLQNQVPQQATFEDELRALRALNLARQRRMTLEHVSPSNAILAGIGPAITSRRARDFSFGSTLQSQPGAMSGLTLPNGGQMAESRMGASLPSMKVQTQMVMRDALQEPENWSNSTHAKKKGGAQSGKAKLCAANDEVGDEEYFSKKTSDTQKERFPVKLYRMVYECEKKGLGDVVSFLPHGRAFAIHEPDRFSAEIMPKYFAGCQLSSLQKQLNLYGFHKITVGKEKGGLKYFHECFLRNRPLLCETIQRKRVSKSTVAAPGASAFRSQQSQNHQENSESKAYFPHPIVRKT